MKSQKLTLTTKAKTLRLVFFSIKGSINKLKINTANTPPTYPILIDIKGPKSEDKYKGKVQFSG